MSKSLSAGLSAAAVALALAAWNGAHAAPPAAAGLQPHRAVYDLKLSRTRGTSRIESVRGRILYDFSGSPCAGYELQFRQVSELDSGEGKTALSDLRSTTWEDGAAKAFRFNSENRLNDTVSEIVNGDASRKANALSVSLKKPTGKTFTVSPEAVFPTEHMRAILAAAQQGKSLLELQVYDGSDTGDKIYSTLTVIGHPLAPTEKPPHDASAKEPALANLKRWPVTISYFDKDAKSNDATEQQPVYAISFELYENGISRALSLDYSDFTISGEMTSLELKKPKACKN